MAGLGSFPFARHYLGNHCYFLLLCLLRCFSSAGLRTMCDMSSTCQVSPFGNRRIKSYLLIPSAYRSLSRPSSPLRAKASPVYSFLLSSTHMPFAPYGVLFDMLFKLHVACCGLRAWAFSFQLATFNRKNVSIVVCSSFLTSSNMSKNFLSSSKPEA
jgi:hypothetical protein